VAESERIFGAVHHLTPLVQTLSLDEAWIDLKGTERLNGGPPAFQLARLQKWIEDETGLSVSIGLAPNRFLAKIASELDKPRGFSVIGVAEAQGLLAPRPVTTLPGVGPVFGRTLRSDGFATIGDLAAAEVKDLVRRYGETGLRLHDLSHARDSRPVNPDHDRRGMSAETTFNDDLTTAEALEAELWPLCEKLASKARRDGRRARPAETGTGRALSADRHRHVRHRRCSGRARRSVRHGRDASPEDRDRHRRPARQVRSRRRGGRTRVEATK